VQILNNKNGNTIENFIKTHSLKNAKLRIITDFLSLATFWGLYKEFKVIKDIKIICKNQDALNISTESEPKYILIQSHIATVFNNWLKEKAEIKLLENTNSVNFNLFLFVTESKTYVIQGSSTFSLKGFGIKPSTESLDMNTLYDEQTAQFEELFYALWSDESITKNITYQIEEQVKNILRDKTPQELYYCTLYKIFSNQNVQLDEENIIRSKTGFKETMVWSKLYNFQKDGVLGAIEKLEKHNGCIIADSVGLGKTFEALAVIKYYELRNDRVLVLCPKKLRENWTIYTINDKRNILSSDRFGYDVLNHTDLSRESGKSGEIDLKTINWGNYDLIVIDESHNFRNNNPVKTGQSRYSKLMNEIIKSGVKTKVLMLSATPVNNRLSDLKNQIAFATEGNTEALKEEGIKNIDDTLRVAQQKFSQWQKLENEKRSIDKLLDMLNFDYFKILDALTIARSRKHIQKYYDTSLIGAFPERLKPINIKSDIDLDENYPPLLEINKTIKKLYLAAYSPMKYIYPSKAEEYSEKYDTKIKEGNSFKQSDREQSLIHLMRVNLLKRMESSIHSFALTVEKLIAQIDFIITKIDNHEVSIEAGRSILEIDEDDGTLAELLVGGKVKVLLSDIDTIRWREDLEEDREKLAYLLHESKQITHKRDQKLKTLTDTMEHKINNPINGSNKKLIIFTAFADTANYLYTHIADYFKTHHSLHSALVTGSGTNKSTLKSSSTDLNSILTNFSPISKERSKIELNQKEEIDILIATDCISEGQNLQDCDYLINYDIHWNPVRIIQRFGRIDRLGSKNKQIQLVNFWPNMELDEYINLEARVSGRMVLLDISATGEENVIAIDEERQMNDLEYRRNQLKQLQEQVTDLEDLSGGISITDLTLSDIKMDLLNYQKEHKEELDLAPTGIYALGTSKNEISPPSVIFCLKALSEQKTTQTAIEPYYLVHIAEDGTILHHYTQTKKILDIFRLYAKEGSRLDENAIALFEKETEDGKNMSNYQNLLKLSVESIIGKKQEAGVQSLFSRGGTAIDKGSFRGIDDFEVVGYLIMKGKY